MREQSILHFIVTWSKIKPGLHQQTLPFTTPVAYSACLHESFMHWNSAYEQALPAGQQQVMSRDELPSVLFLLAVVRELGGCWQVDCTMQATLMLCQTAPIRMVPLGLGAASQSNMFSVQSSLYSIYPFVSIFLPGHSPTPSRQSQEQYLIPSDIQRAIFAFCELLGWMPCIFLKKIALTREQAMGELERKPTISSDELTGLNWTEVMAPQATGAVELRGIGLNKYSPLFLWQVYTLRVLVEAMTMQMPSRLKSQQRAFSITCGNTTGVNPLLRYITIVCPTSTVNFPSGDAARSYTLACLWRKLATLSIGAAVQNIRLLTVDSAMRELLPGAGTKVIICLSVLQDWQTSLLSSLVKLSKEQYSSRQIHCEDTVESCRVQVAKWRPSGERARLEVMLVGICLAIRRADVLCIDFKSAGIIRIENGQRTQQNRIRPPQQWLEEGRYNFTLVVGSKMIYLISRLDNHLETGAPLFRTSLKTDIVLALLLVPAVTIGGVWCAAEKVSTVGRTFTEGIGGAAKKTYYAISRPFRKGVDLPQEMKDRLLDEQEVRQFKQRVRKEVQQNKDKVYICVKGFYSSTATQRDSLVVEMDNQKSVSHLLQLCKLKWKTNNTATIQVFSHNKLLPIDTPLSALPRNDLGIVQLSLTSLQSFG